MQEEKLLQIEALSDFNLFTLVHWLHSCNSGLFMRNLLSAFFLIIGLSSPLYAQLNELNERKIILLNSLEESSPDTLKYSVYTKIAESFKYVDLDSTLKYGILAQATISKDEYPEKSAIALGFSTWVYFMKGNYDQSLEIAERAYQLVENLPGAKKVKFDLLHAQGTIYGALGMYELALKKFYEIIDIYSSDSNEEGYFVTLSNIGVMYMKLESYESALEIFEKLDEDMPIHLEARVSIPVNLGFIYYDLRDFEKAKFHLNQALAQNGNIDPRVYGLSNFKLGQVYNAELDYRKAIRAFEASIEVFESRQNELETIQSLNGLALAYKGLNMLNQAFTYAEKGYEIANRYNAIPEKQATLESLYQISKAKGDIETALSYHEDYKEISDFLKNTESRSQIGRITAEYEFNKRESDLLAASRQAELMSQSKIRQQQTLLFASLVVIALSGLVMIGMYRNFHQKKENNYLLNLKNQEIQDQAEKLRESNMVKDRIFSMIAHDLRGPLSSLYGVISLIEMNKASQEELDKLIPNVARRFKYTSTLLNNLLQWAQSQMEGYRVNPEVFDLHAVISSKRLLLQTNIDDKELEFCLPDGEYLVYADLNMIDLVIQNLLSNAIKFSHKGDSINVDIHTEGDLYKVSVTDTGTGIKKEHLDQLFKGTFFSTMGTMDEKGTGLGLMLCKEFVERNGGEIIVESYVSKGSTFSFTLPIAKE